MFSKMSALGVTPCLGWDSRPDVHFCANGTQGGESIEKAKAGMQPLYSKSVTLLIFWNRPGSSPFRLPRLLATCPIIDSVEITFLYVGKQKRKSLCLSYLNGSICNPKSVRQIRNLGRASAKVSAQVQHHHGKMRTPPQWDQGNWTASTGRRYLSHLLG